MWSIKRFIKTYPIPLTILFCITTFYALASLHIGFLGDDWRYLYEIQKTANPFNVITHPYTSIFGWRPLSDLSWALNYVAFGTNPIGYHVFNLTVFFGTLIILFFTLRRILTEHTALWATTIFALLPIHDESITWLSGRTDSLALFFFLLSLNSYILYRKSRTHPYIHLIFSTFFFAASIFCKESLILGPAMFVLVDRIVLHKFANWKNTLTTLLPYVACVAGLLIMRSIVIGGVVSNDSTFTDQYSLIPTVSSIVATFHAFTFFFNRSTVVEALPNFATMWKYVLLPLGLAILLFITFIQKPWKNSSLRNTIVLCITVGIITILPVLSLMENITPDLQHIRFIYAPSVVVAVLLAYIFTTYSSTGIRYAQHAVLGGFVLLCVLANITNIQPWKEASAQTQTVLEEFAYHFPEFATATTPTTVYILHTPSEYRGAYLFHDYYSLQQAAKQYTHNPNLILQTVGTKAASPAPLCDEHPSQNIHVLSWNGSGFDYQDDVLAPWYTASTTAATIKLNTQKAWKDAQVKVHDAQMHFATNSLVVDHFGKNPEIQITLPDGSYSRDWKTLQLNTYTQKPLVFNWNAPTPGPAGFNSISIEPTQNTTPIQLCAYPNWIVAGSLRDIEIAFTPGAQTQIVITSLEMY